MDDGEEDGWALLPDILLENVLEMLTYRQRYYCSMVCKNWYELFDSPLVWRRFTVGERTFTYRRFNLYKGYQHEISHHRVQMCLGKIGHHARYLHILPITNFFNLYEFLNVLSCYMEFFPEFPMPRLKSFHFTFACESRGLTGTVVLGTGGKLLQQLKRLLGNLQNIESLTLNQLLLDNKEMPGLLEGFCNNCQDTLLYLEVLNCTKHRYPFFYVGMFNNLEKLVITPLQLTREVVETVAQNTAVKELVIVQDPYSGETEVEAVSSHTWWDVKQMAPHLRVRLEVRGASVQELLIQENAPVHAVIYTAPLSKARDHIILSLVDQYSNCLKMYGHLGLPRVHGPRRFHDRGDSCLLLLVSECKHLETLIINERVSTATLLLLASRSKSLKNLFVRRNAILLKNDWPRSPEWPEEYYAWLKFSACCYEATEAEVGRLLDHPKWRMLSDREFKRLQI